MARVGKVRDSGRHLQEQVGGSETRSAAMNTKCEERGKWGGGQMMFAATNMDFREGGKCDGGIEVRCHRPLGVRDRSHHCQFRTILLYRFPDR